MNTKTNEAELAIAKADAARCYLNDVKRLQRKAELAEVEYKLAISASSGLRGIDYSRDVVQTSVSPDAIPNAVMKYTELREQVDALKAAADESFTECYGCLNELDPEEGTALRMKYLLGLTDGAIAMSLYVSPRTVNRRIASGLISLYDNGLPAEYRLNKEQAI